MCADRNPRPGSLVNLVNSAMDIIDRIVAGDTVTKRELSNVEWLQQFLGLDKPLTDYSRRTRQRYAAGARQGKRAEQIRTEERERRKQSVSSRFPGITASQLTTLNRLRRDILAIKPHDAGDRQVISGPTYEDFYSDDMVRDMLVIYGYAYLRNVWTDQLDSLRHYAEGDTDPGNARWRARGSLEDQFRHSIEVPGSTDPYYYYHGRKR